MQPTLPFKVSSEHNRIKEYDEKEKIWLRELEKMREELGLS